MAQFACAKGHEVKWSVASTKFRCDVCKRSGDDSHYRCEVDDYDVCTKCKPAPSDFITFGKCLIARPKTHNVTTGFLPVYLCIDVPISSLLRALVTIDQCRGDPICSAHWLSQIDKDLKEEDKEWPYINEKNHNKRHLWLVRTELSQANEPVDAMIASINLDEFDPALRLFYSYNCSLCNRDKILGPLYFSTRNPAVHVCLECFDKLAFTQVVKQHTPWVCNIPLMTKLTLPSIGVVRTDSLNQQQQQAPLIPSGQTDLMSSDFRAPVVPAPSAGGYADMAEAAPAQAQVATPVPLPASTSGYAAAELLSASALGREEYMNISQANALSASNYASSTEMKSAAPKGLSYAAAEVTAPKQQYAAADTLMSSGISFDHGYAATDKVAAAPSSLLYAAADGLSSGALKRQGYSATEGSAPSGPSMYATADGLVSGPKKEAYAAVDGSHSGGTYAATDGLHAGHMKEGYAAVIEEALGARPILPPNASESQYDFVDPSEQQEQRAEPAKMAAIGRTAAPAKMSASAQPTNSDVPLSEGSRVTQGTMPRPWNEQFQSIIKLPNRTLTERAHQALSMKSLHDAFIMEATRLATVIVNEMHLPVDQRTIKPKDFGGGSKFAENGIFIKFATDIHGIYGGDTFAMKSASLELLGLKWFFNLNLPGLHVPLMTLINYRGWRLVCTSALPLGKDTLRYGSDDGGMTVKGGTIDRLEAPDLEGKEEFLNGKPVVHQGDPVLNDLMRQAGELLHLKAHKVGRTPVKPSIYGPTDIEGHLGKDGRYYVVDTARVFPPEPLWKSQIALYFSDRPMSLKDDNTRYAAALHDKEQSFDRILSISWEMMELTVPREKWKEEMSRRLNAPFDALQRIQVTDAIVFVTGKGLVNIPLSLYVGMVLRGPGMLLPAFGSKAKSLYCLMRPDRKYAAPKRAPSKPFNSDAFTAFGTVDPGIKEDNEDIRKEVQVNLPLQLTYFFEYFSCGNERIRGMSEFSQRLHNFGVNVRYTGWLASLLGNEGMGDDTSYRMVLRSLTLMSLWVRTWKVYVFDILRRTRTELSFKEQLVKYLNLLFGSSRRADLFRQVHMKIALTSKFGKFPQFPAWLLHSVATLKFRRSAVFIMLRPKLGVVFSSRFDVMMDETIFQTAEPFTLQDIARFEPTVSSVLKEYMECSFQSTMYAVTANSPIERSLALHNQLQELYPDHTPEFVQSLLQVAEAYVYEDLSTADEYVMLARAAYDNLQSKSASVAISLCYVRGLIEQRRDNKPAAIQFYLTAMLLLSYLMPSVRFWSPSQGFGKWSKPLELAPYRFGSAHPLVLVMMSKLAMLFRSDPRSPFMNVLAVEAHDAVINNGFPGDLEACIAILGAAFPPALAFARAANDPTPVGRGSSYYMGHFSKAETAYTDPRVAVVIDIGRSGWVIPDIYEYREDQHTSNKMLPPLGRSAFTDLALLEWLDFARIPWPASKIELASITIEQLVERQFAPICRADIFTAGTVHFSCPPYVEIGDELVVDIEFRALEEYRSQGYIYLLDTQPAWEMNAWRWKQKLQTRTPKVQAASDGCYRVTVNFGTRDLMPGTYAVSLQDQIPKEKYGYEIVHVGERAKREMPQQVVFYPSLGDRPEIAIPVLDLAGQTWKKFLHAHGAVWALSSNGEVWAAGCGDKGQLAQGNKANVKYGLVKIGFPSLIVDIACTQSYTQRGTDMTCFACDDNGSVYIWGDTSGYYATEMAHANNKSDSLLVSPRIIDPFVGIRVVKIECFDGSCLAALANDGKLYFFGRMCPPFLQTGKHTPISCSQPTEAAVLRNRPVKDVTLTGSCAVIVLVSGEALFFNASGTELTPIRPGAHQKISGPPIKFVAAVMPNDIALLDDNGQIWLWAHKATPWLGNWARPPLADTMALERISFPSDNRQFISISSGGNVPMLLAVTREGELWTMLNDKWGYLERCDASPQRVTGAAAFHDFGLMVSYDATRRDDPAPPPLAKVNYLYLSPAPHLEPTHTQLSQKTEPSVTDAPLSSISQSNSTTIDAPALKFAHSNPSAPVIVSLRKKPAAAAAAGTLNHSGLASSSVSVPSSQMSSSTSSIVPSAVLSSSSSSLASSAGALTAQYHQPGIGVSGARPFNSFHTENRSEPSVMMGSNVVIGSHVFVGGHPAKPTTISSTTSAMVVPGRPGTPANAPNIAQPESPVPAPVPPAVIRTRTPAAPTTDALLAEATAALPTEMQPLVQLLQRYQQEIAELKAAVAKQSTEIASLKGYQ